MNDQPFDYEHITENDSRNILDDEFKNTTEILIAEYIGSIPKNYLKEHQRLSAYTFYPPLNAQQLRTIVIDNITSTDIKRQINEKVLKQLESIFQNKFLQWNSIIQTTAKRFITNAVEEAVDLIRDKFLENLDEQQQQTSNIIIQRFILVDNLLKLV